MDDRFDDGRSNHGISDYAKMLRWDQIHTREFSREELSIQYDGWLESDERILKELSLCNTQILDLGCGQGIDTLHLIESGHKVIACDFSDVAIRNVANNIPEAETLRFNMKKDFPFQNEQFEFVIANKSIHYFSEMETQKIISELYRIIKPNGVFVFVVNSTNDSNFGAGQGVELEKNFYEVRGTTKRFFDRESLEKFFDKEQWEFVCMKEEISEDERIKTVQLQNDGKINKKVTWTCMVKRK